MCASSAVSSSFSFAYASLRYWTSFACLIVSVITYLLEFGFTEAYPGTRVSNRPTGHTPPVLEAAFWGLVGGLALVLGAAVTFMRARRASASSRSSWRSAPAC